MRFLSQFLQAPKEDHWAAALRVVRYLKGCPGQGVLLRMECDLMLSGWSDSDWATCPQTRRSVYSDSQSALHLAQNPVFHERSKYIEVDCHFVRDALLDGTIGTSHVPTQFQLGILHQTAGVTIV
ncbi:hypothetical protein LIER_41638 [Lithospermum erythrorhizon]|uniref:Uncharacterized protein n=1 Tax=Lithospermum erythrorhizon TaxID=34254 RepID=A0AAV3RFU9_LITER